MAISLKYQVTSNEARVIAAFQSELNACDFAREFSRRNGPTEVFLNAKNGGLVAQYEGGETTAELHSHEMARRGYGAYPKPIAAVFPT